MVSPSRRQRANSPLARPRPIEFAEGPQDVDLDNSAPLPDEFRNVRIRELGHQPAFTLPEAIIVIETLLGVADPGGLSGGQIAGQVRHGGDGHDDCLVCVCGVQAKFRRIATPRSGRVGGRTGCRRWATNSPSGGGWTGRHTCRGWPARYRPELRGHHRRPKAGRREP